MWHAPPETTRRRFPGTNNCRSLPALEAWSNHCWGHLQEINRYAIEERVSRKGKVMLHRLEINCFGKTLLSLRPTEQIPRHDPRVKFRDIRFVSPFQNCCQSSIDSLESSALSYGKR